MIQTWSVLCFFRIRYRAPPPDRSCQRSRPRRERRPARRKPTRATLDAEADDCVRTASPAAAAGGGKRSLRKYVWRVMGVRALATAGGAQKLRD